MRVVSGSGSGRSGQSSSPLGGGGSGGSELDRLAQAVAALLLTDGFAEQVVAAAERVSASRQRHAPGMLLPGTVSTNAGAIITGPPMKAMVYLGGAATACACYVAPHVASSVGAGTDVWVAPVNGSRADLMVVAARNSSGAGIYDVRAFGARCDGVTDDTVANQTAITAASNAGRGQVLIPGPSLISDTLTINADNVQLIGYGRGSRLIAASGFPAAPMILVTGPSGSASRQGIVLRDLLLQNTANSAASGIELQSTYYATLKRVDIEGVFATNIYLNGQVAPNTIFGAYTRIVDCHIGAIPNGGAGSSGIGILTNNHEWNKIERCTLNWFNGSGGIAIKVQNSDVRITDCDFDACWTGVLLNFSNASVVQGCSFARGYSNFIHNIGAKQAKVIGNQFEDWAGNATNNPNAAPLVVENTGLDNLYVGNVFRNGDTWPYGIYENNGPTGVSLYAHNDLRGSAVMRATTNGGIFRGNLGYNPVGPLTSPTMPASGVALTNPFGVDCTVYFSGGTVTAIAVAGQTLGITSGAVRVSAGETLTITYSAQPVWHWIGE